MPLYTHLNICPSSRTPSVRQNALVKLLHWEADLLSSGARGSVADDREHVTCADHLRRVPVNLVMQCGIPFRAFRPPGESGRGIQDSLGCLNGRALNGQVLVVDLAANEMDLVGK